MDSSHMTRYAQIAQLLAKHGQRDLLERAGIEQGLQSDDDDLGGDPEAFADDLASMGVTFIKLGQVLSTRPDLLPDPYLEALAALQDDVAPVEPVVIRELIEKELGAALTDRFADFSPEPIAAASMAQVHAATTLDGRRVAVKVRRPGIVEQVGEDLDALARIAGAIDGHTETGARFRFTELVDEFRAALIGEIDFTAEARHLRLMAEQLDRYDRLQVPLPIDEMTTPAVLVMDLVEGRKVTDLGALSSTDLDGTELADQLLRAFLDQALVHGLLHADPHPGNVLVTDTGDLALIDLGMVGHLSEDTRSLLLELLMALAERRPNAAVDAVVRAGTPLPNFDRRSLERETAELVTRFRTGSVADLSAGDLMVSLSRACATAELRPPPALTLVGKAMASLDAVAKALDPGFEPNATVRDHVASLLLHQVEERTSPLRAARAALASARLVESLPSRAEHLLDDLERGEFTVKVDAFDPDELLRGLEKIASRLTVGILVASVVIGASIAMRTPTDTKLLGYPAIAVVFFVLAGLGALGLAAHAVIGDRRDRRRRRF